jgi:hypothetical protein
MKNVTITLDEEVLRWVRIRAAELDTSVSRLVGDMLRREMEQQHDVEQQIAEYPGHPISDGTPYPKREELYDRPVLRRYQRADLREGQPGFAEEETRSGLDQGAVAGQKPRHKSSDPE